MCPACDSSDQDGRRYCGQCGHALRPVCARCAFVNRAVDRFCGGCGLAVAEAVTTQAPADAHTRVAAPPKTTVAQAEAKAAAPRAPSPAGAPSRPATPVKPVPPIATTRPRAAHVSDAELALLMATPPPMPKQTEPDLPRDRISQSDLDRLFEAG